MAISSVSGSKAELGNTLAGARAVINEAQSLLGSSKAKVEQVEPSNSTSTQQDLSQPRQTYGILSLELMSDSQYQAFQRITAGLSQSEKIAIAQTISRAGNLAVSVESVLKERTQSQGKESELGDLSDEDWSQIAESFRDTLDNIEVKFSQYNGTLGGNYNDIFKRSMQAKDARILREFSHASKLGGTSVDMMG